MIGLYDEEGLLKEEYHRVIQRAADEALKYGQKRGGADIFVLNGEEMRARNLAFRGIDDVTDVLSFPAAQRGEAPADGFYGDILLCPSRAGVQAEEYGHSLERELAFLTIHGMLHLFGYDHVEENEEKNMLQAQKGILERMELHR